MSLTEEEKEKLIGEGKQYKNFKRETNSQILFHKREIENLEREVLDSLPSTPRGKRVCEQCGVKSMLYDNTIVLGDCSEIIIYQCEICGYKISERD